LETASSVDKPSDKVVAPVAQNEKTAEPSNPPANAGQVAGVNTVNYPAQGIVVWGSIIAVLILGLVLLVIYLKSRLGRGDKKPEQADPGDRDGVVPVIKETSILLPEANLNPEGVVVAAGPSRASFSFPRIEFTAIRKDLGSIKTGILTILTSITAFFSKILTSIKKFFISLITGLARFIASIRASFRRVFRAVVFATKKGLVATLVSIKNHVVAIVASLKRGFRAVVFAFKTFFVNVASAIRNALISIKTGLVATLVSIKNLVVAMAASLKRSFLAVIHAIVAFIVKITSSIKTFLANVIIALRRVLVAIVTSLQKILVSMAAFFIRVLFTTANLITAIVTSLKKVVSMIINAAITLLANILSAVTKIVTSLMAGTLKAMLAMVKGLLNILNFIAKLADSALAQLDFQNPTIHRSPPNFPKIATFLLVGLTSATVSAVLAFKFISVIKTDSLVVLDKEAVDQTEEIKIGSSRNEDMVLIKVSDGSNVNVRQEATTSSKIIAKIKYTKMVSKGGEEGDWTEVATGPDQLSGIEESLTGWVSSKLIETSGEELSQVLESQKH